jgi:hypothetical protein
MVTLDDRFKTYLKEFELNDPIKLKAIQEVEDQLAFNFSKEYIDFLLHSNGGEGSIGHSYLRLWRLEELIEDNEGYGVQDFAPGLLIIGSDGGDTAYCIDTRFEEKPFVSVPFVGMDLDEVQQCGNTFTEFLRFLYGA